MLLYLSPYSEHPSQHSSTSPCLTEDHAGTGTIPYAWGMIQLPSVDNADFTPHMATLHTQSTTTTTTGTTATACTAFLLLEQRGP